MHPSSCAGCCGQPNSSLSFSQGAEHYVLASLRAHFVGYVKPTAGIFQWNRKKGGDSVYCPIYLFFAIRGVCGFIQASSVISIAEVC